MSARVQDHLREEEVGALGALGEQEQRQEAGKNQWGSEGDWSPTVVVYYLVTQGSSSDITGINPTIQNLEI